MMKRTRRRTRRRRVKSNEVGNMISVPQLMGIGLASLYVLLHAMLASEKRAEREAEAAEHNYKMRTIFQ